MFNLQFSMFNLHQSFVIFLHRSIYFSASCLFFESGNSLMKP